MNSLPSDGIPFHRMNSPPSDETSILLKAWFLRIHRAIVAIMMVTMEMGFFADVRRLTSPILTTIGCTPLV